MIDEKKLKPCPFCGYHAIGESQPARKGYDAYIMCNRCGAEIKSIYYDTLEQAEEAVIEAWNNRAEISLENKTSDWIPCSERLPIHEGEYLVTCKGKYRHFTEVLYFQHGRFLSCLCEVVAWFDAPLPEPYKGE